MERGRQRLRLPLRLLGQSGCRLQFSDCIVYLDPYLSNSVQELDAADLARLQPIPLRPDEVHDADWVLITHEHIDHCDPHTLPRLAAASPSARFMGPAPVLRLLAEWGVAETRLHVAQEDWCTLAPGIAVRAVPAAHPHIERDALNRLRFVGFVFEHRGKRIYLAGDTGVAQELLDALEALRPITAALLPVNEQNFFRDRRGIIGNMSVREAFQMADELEFEQVIPVHWDMFAANDVGEEEIRAVFNHMQPRFELHVRPQQLIL